MISLSPYRTLGRGCGARKASAARLSDMVRTQQHATRRINGTQSCQGRQRVAGIGQHVAAQKGQIVMRFHLIAAPARRKSQLRSEWAPLSVVCASYGPRINHARTKPPKTRATTTPMCWTARTSARSSMPLILRTRTKAVGADGPAACGGHCRPFGADQQFERHA